MSRIECRHCLISSSYLAGLFNIFIFNIKPCVLVTLYQWGHLCDASDAGHISNDQVKIFAVQIWELKPGYREGNYFFNLLIEFSEIEQCPPATPKTTPSSQTPLTTLQEHSFHTFPKNRVRVTMAWQNSQPFANPRNRAKWQYIIYDITLGKGYKPQPSALADNPYLDLDYSGYHKNLIQ